VLQLDLNIKQCILDLRLGRLVYSNVDFDDQSGVVRGWALEVNAGAKHWRNDIAMEYAIYVGDPPPVLEDKFETSQAWWDPMLGGNARIILSRKVMLTIYASGGGFGIGDSSDFTYDFMYLNTFKVSKLLAVDAGFRSFRYDRTADGLTTKVAVTGPFVGVSFVF